MIPIFWVEKLGDSDEKGKSNIAASRDGWHCIEFVFRSNGGDV